MLTKLKAHNYKGFEDLNIPIKPITVLLGPNNAGKSSIISLLRVLSQTLTSNDDNVSLLLNGDYGDFGTYKDIVYSNRRRRHIQFSIGIHEPRLRRYYRTKRLKQSQEATINLSYKYRPGIKEIVLKKSELILGKQSAYTTKYSEDTEKHILTSLEGIEIPSSLRSSLSKRLRLINFLLTHPSFMLSSNKSDLIEGLSNSPSRLLRTYSRINSEIRNNLLHFEYLGGMRIQPSRTFLYSGERRNSVGSSGEHAINIMVLDSLRKASRTNKIKQKVIQWLQQADMCSDIDIRDLSERHYELYIKHPHTGEYQNYADVGYGNSQIIPVLVGGYNLPPNSIFAVEQPEIHLHPKAQAELGDFFLNLHSNNVQSIIETHSEHLVLRLQQHIAEGNLNPEDIAIYYIYSNSEKKEAVHMPINSKGIFTVPWPEGFFPERLNEAKKLAFLRGKHHDN